MFNQKLRMNIAIIPALLIMTSCGTQTSVGIQPSSAPSASVTSTANAGALGTLTFSKVMGDKVAQYNGMISQNVSKNNGQQPSADSALAGGGSISSSSAPMVAAVGSIRSDGARLASSISYFPTPGAFEEYAVINFEEAKTKGFSGTYLQALNQIVKPVIVALGSDARLVNSSGSSDANGVNLTNPTPPSPSSGKDIAIYQPYYANYQWQFTYASASKKEVYNISISSQETLVLKQTWGLKDLNPADIKIDSKDAIDLVTKAIKDKSFVLPDNNNSTDYYNPQNETLYEIPKNTNWYLYLEKENGNLIWNINLNTNYDSYPIAYAASPPGYGVADSVGVSGNITKTDSSSSPIPAGSPSISPTAMPTSVPYPVYSYPPTPEYWYSGGYARIDATTGKILSLVRPSRYKNVVYPPTPYASPYPVPVQIDSQSGGSATVKN